MLNRTKKHNVNCFSSLIMKIVYLFLSLHLSCGITLLLNLQYLPILSNTDFVGLTLLNLFHYACMGL